LSIVFGGVQLLTLPGADHLDAVPLILQFFSAAVCLLLASLAAQPGNRAGNTAVAAIAFSVCFVALLIGGIMAMKNSSNMAPIKYVIVLVYGGLYGIFGLAFSLLAEKREEKKEG
jgi:hypothetical protein